MSRLRHPLAAIAGATLLTVPWILAFLTGARFGSFGDVAVTGLAILGAAFLLTWGAETAEKDVPSSFAIAVLAVLAVAPEYAVDAYYAWEAGANAGTPAGMQAANHAVANMTGANRILIGIGWSGVALFTLLRSGAASDPAVLERDGWLTDAVDLDRDISMEVTFLLAATAWAFFIPFNGGIDMLDTAVLVGLFGLYVLVAVLGDVSHDEDHVGVPAYLQARPFSTRVATTLSLFAFSGVVIFTAVHPFVQGLEGLAVVVGMPEFFMIQWVAPLASESPELVIVVLLVVKARSTAGFNALISSKLNQWTLLIGTLAVVYSIASGSVGTLPFDARQSAEIWLTAAQSLFALALLIDFELEAREAVVLLVLFVAQVGGEILVLRVLPVAHPETVSVQLLYGFTVLYVVLGVVLFVLRRNDLRRVVGRAGRTVRTALFGGTTA